MFDGCAFPARQIRLFRYNVTWSRKNPKRGLCFCGYKYLTYVRCNLLIVGLDRRFFCSHESPLRSDESPLSLSCFITPPHLTSAQRGFVADGQSLLAEGSGVRPVFTQTFLGFQRCVFMFHPLVLSYTAPQHVCRAPTRCFVPTPEYVGRNHTHTHIEVRVV